MNTSKDLYRICIFHTDLYRYRPISFSMVGKYRYVSFSNTETTGLQNVSIAIVFDQFRSLGIFEALNVSLNAGYS